jgi:hypothetical protein
MRKQGSADVSNSRGRMRSPYSNAYNEKAVSQIGQNMGNHVTDNGGKTVNSIEPPSAGRGFQAPQPKSRQYHCGSQGRR